MKQST